MAAEGQHGAPGWYPDPDQVATVRYWDGSGWTEQRAPATNAKPASGEFTLRGTLGVIGALAVAVGVFLPMLDSGTSLHIADNSVMTQSKLAGIFALLAALAAGAKAVEARFDKGISFSLILLGALVIAGAVYGGTGERVDLVVTGPLIGGEHIQGSPGVGLYVLGVGGLLVSISGLIRGGSARSAW
jgi:hypothetical protein